MAIKGTFKEVSFPDVLQLLSTGRKTGCLKVTDGQNFGHIYFHEGNISFSNILNRKDRMGDILVHEGKITPEQLEMALQRQKEKGSKQRIGDILIEMGLITNDELASYVCFQIEEAIFTLLRWPEGQFYFEPDILPIEENITVFLDVQNLLLEEARRIDEWQNLEKKLPSYDTILERVLPLEKAGLPLLSPEEEKIFSLVNGQWSLEEIIQQSGYGEFKTCKIVYGLLLSGLLKRAGQKKEELTVKDLSMIEEHRNLGSAFYKTKMYEEALREYRRILEIVPHQAEARFFLGLINFQQGDFPTAAIEFQEAIALETNKPFFYNNFGLVLEHLGDYWGAISQYQKALELNSNNKKILTNLTVCYYKSGEYEKASEICRKLLALDSENEVAHFYLGLLSLHRGDYHGALECWKKGSATKSPYFGFLNNLGVIFEREGNVEEAERYYKEALRISPDSIDVCRNLADLYYRSGQYEKAVETFLRLVALKESGEVFAKLGNLFFKQGKKEQAIQYWEKALNLDSTNEVLKRNIFLAKRT